MELSQVHVVLVRPRGPANVGMVARGIANHGLGGLVLVAPPAFDPDEARWRAPGATQVIDQAHIVSTVAEAVAQSRLVVGTTARRRRWRWPVWSPGELAERVLEQEGPAVLLFGPEDAGLSSEDLAGCHALLTLPTGPASSLNLAQAVTVTAHALRTRLAESQADALPPRRAATAARLQALREETEAVLELGGYLRGHSPEQLRVTLQALLARLSPDGAEAGMLQGMVHKVRWTLEHPGEEPD